MHRLEEETRECLEAGYAMGVSLAGGDWLLAPGDVTQPRDSHDD